MRCLIIINVTFPALESYGKEKEGVEGKDLLKIKPAYVIISSFHFTFILRYHRSDSTPYQYHGIPPEAWSLLQSRGIYLLGSEIGNDLVSLGRTN
jgi:hypothetical protein